MTIVVRKDGTKYVLKDLGIRTKDFIVSSPSPRNYTEEIENRDGLYDAGTTIDARSITCIFKYTSVDMPDFPLLRNEVFKIFDTRESFYLIDSREPQKQWLVKCSNSYDIKQAYVYGDFEIDFIAFKGYAESIGTTLNPLTFNEEVWQIGQGLVVSKMEYGSATWKDIGHKNWSEL